VPEQCPGVPDDLLMPRETWDDPTAYDEQAEKLVRLFNEHFEQYEDMASSEILEAGPQLQMA